MRAARWAAPVAPPSVASGFAALEARNAAEAEARDLCDKLPTNQRDALVLAAQGLTVPQVASAMGKSASTTDGYLRDGRALLGVCSTVEAAVMLTRAGLV